MRRPIATLLLAAYVCAGCYRYLPTESAAVPPGSTVRVRLNDAQTRRFAGIVPDETRTVEGRIIEQEPDSLLLEVAIQTDLRGTRVQTINQRIDLPRDGVIDMHLRTLDRGKTGLVLGGATLVAVLGIGSTLAGAFRSDRPGDPGGTEIVVPIFLRIRW